MSLPRPLLIILHFACATLLPLPHLFASPPGPSPLNLGLSLLSHPPPCRVPLLTCPHHSYPPSHSRTPTFLCSSYCLCLPSPVLLPLCGIHPCFSPLLLTVFGSQTTLYLSPVVVHNYLDSRQSDTRPLTWYSSQHCCAPTTPRGVPSLAPSPVPLPPLPLSRPLAHSRHPITLCPSLAPPLPIPPNSHTLLVPLSPFALGITPT